MTIYLSISLFTFYVPGSKMHFLPKRDRKRRQWNVIYVQQVPIFIESVCLWFTCSNCPWIKKYYTISIIVKRVEKPIAQYSIKHMYICTHVHGSIYARARTHTHTHTNTISIFDIFFLALQTVVQPYSTYKHTHTHKHIQAQLLAFSSSQIIFVRFSPSHQKQPLINTQYHYSLYSRQLQQAGRLDDYKSMTYIRVPISG